MRIQRDQLVDEIKMMEMKALPPPILTEEDERKIEVRYLLCKINIMDGNL